MFIAQPAGRRACIAALLAAATALAGCMSGGDHPPRMQQDGEFVCPAAAGVGPSGGEVILRYDITASGSVANARVESSSPSGVCDAAALAYVQARRYQPAQRAGVAAPVLGRTETVRFRAGDGDVPAPPN